MKNEVFKPTLSKSLTMYPTPRMDACSIELMLNGKWPAIGNRKFVLAWSAQMIEAELMEMTDKFKELEAELAKSKEQVAFANKRVEQIECLYDLLMIRYEQIEVELDGKKSEKIRK